MKTEQSRVRDYNAFGLKIIFNILYWPLKVNLIDNY